MRFRKWRNTRTGSIHIVQGYGWIALCGEPLGDLTENPAEWKATHFTIGACDKCRRMWKGLK